MLFGIDVSHHQDWIDWQKVRTSGVRFAIIKASEGEEYIDPMFEQNMRGAAEADIVTGSYHFFLPRYDPLAQARHYVRTLQELAGGRPTLPPCVDIETPGLGKSGFNQAVRVFLEEIFRLTGRTGMIYVSPGFWKSYLPVPVLSNYKLLRSGVDWAAEHPLWEAHYTSGWPYQVYPWAGWAFWQYSSSGQIAGISTRVDLDLFSGTPADLSALVES
jgi:lysozyme